VEVTQSLRPNILYKVRQRRKLGLQWPQVSDSSQGWVWGFPPAAWGSDGWPLTSLPRFALATVI